MKTICPECHHAPSERSHTVKRFHLPDALLVGFCECRCHGVADAGPELLEVCKLIAQWGLRREDQGGFDDGDRILTGKLKAAIAKAEGGSK